MTTINTVNTLIRSTKNQVTYQPVDQQTADIVVQYLQANLTRVGYESGELVAGFASLTKDIDHDGQLVLGDSIMITREPADAVDFKTNISSQVTDKTFTYDRNLTGSGKLPSTCADPTFTFVTPQAGVDSVLSEHTGLTYETGYNYRVIVAGSPTGANGALTSIAGQVGPFSTIEQFTSLVTGAIGTGEFADIAPVVAVSTSARQSVLEQVSSLS